MGRCIKVFNTPLEYANYRSSSDFYKPNVSYVRSGSTWGKEYHYNPAWDDEEGSVVVCTYSVTSTSEPTLLSYVYEGSDDGTSGFTSMEIDGVALPSVVSAYTFSSLGEHVVKYTLLNPNRIGDYAFEGCVDMVNVEIPSGVTVIGHDAFGWCKGLTSIALPNGLTTIDTWAFEGCVGLSSITIPNGVTSIGDMAFCNCSGLTSVNIPSGVTNIGDGVFSRCNSISSITVDSNNGVYDSRNGCNAIINSSTNALIQGCNYTVIPNSVINIGNNAFNGYSGITSISIPNSVTSIGTSAFTSCSGLTSVTIPNSVTSIGDGAFKVCRNLTSIEIPSGVTSIGEEAFYSCNGLTSVTVGAINPPTLLGFYVFDNTNSCPIYVPCESVNSYKAASGWSNYSSRIKGFGCPFDITAKFNVTSTSSPTRIASATSNVSAIEIDGVEQPSVSTGYTFNTSGEHTVRYRLIDNTIIGTSAFTYCSGLTSCTIGSGVTSIDNNAFTQCTSLTSIDIPNSVISIGTYAFSNCERLRSCTIGSGVTSIGDSAFMNCISLTSINIPSGVTSISARTFLGCDSLTSIVIPNSVTSIGYGAFQYCSSLTNCTIGSGVTSIGQYAFYYCSSLTSIEIPNSVTSIDNYAFHYCSGLTSITSNAMTAPTIQSNTFYNVKPNGTLYVPKGSSGYDTWMQNANYYLGKYGWTRVKQ